jgi:hypothetical protein
MKFTNAQKVVGFDTRRLYPSRIRYVAIIRRNTPELIKKAEDPSASTQVSNTKILITHGVYGGGGSRSPNCVDASVGA